MVIKIQIHSNLKYYFKFNFSYLYIEGIVYLERIITMIYLIIYFREDLEKLTIIILFVRKRC